MRHAKQRNKLSRDTAHRKALLRNLCRQVIEHERIETTQAKAKAAKPEVEKLITLGKRGDLHARRQALSELGQDKFLVHRLFEELAPRYADRDGGYTRIVKLGPRRSVSTEIVFLELVLEHAVLAGEGGGMRPALASPPYAPGRCAHSASPSPTRGPGLRAGRRSPDSARSRACWRRRWSGSSAASPSP
jgi:large subunit ribosomal protein L17